jgi:superoxide reductase
VIELPPRITGGQPFEAALTVGKEVAHPSTTEHNIKWIELYFRPAGVAPVFEVGRFEFSAHGESVKGPNQGPAHAAPSVKAVPTLMEPGTLHALAFCNIHGLWESSAPVALE